MGRTSDRRRRHRLADLDRTMTVRGGCRTLGRRVIPGKVDEEGDRSVDTSKMTGRRRYYNTDVQLVPQPLVLELKLQELVKAGEQKESNQTRLSKPNTVDTISKARVRAGKSRA